eukprot:EG_transcript_28543
MLRPSRWLGKAVRYGLRVSDTHGPDKTMQMVEKAMVGDNWRKEYRRHLRFEKNTQRRQREQGEAASAAYYRKLNYGMKMFLWQESVKTLVEVEELLERVGPDFPERARLRAPVDAAVGEEEGTAPPRAHSKKYKRHKVKEVPASPAPPPHVLRGQPSYAIMWDPTGA